MPSRPLPKISFGMIVLNGEPFLRYNLRSLYPFAYQIIVVEGAVPGAANIATPDGHSIDGTIDILQKFKIEEDPENKLIIVVAEDEGYPNGFWPGEKHEQSQAYARRATGDYLWQVDVDEFYKTKDIEVILDILCTDSELAMITFKQISFWGGFDYYSDGWYLWQGGEIFRRLFKWGQNYKYTTHRPPTVLDYLGRDTSKLKILDGHRLAKNFGIRLYHYHSVFPVQVQNKSKYYTAADWATHAREVQNWANNNYLQLNNPFRVHNVYQYASWIERFRGKHPGVIDQLQRDIALGKINVELRPVDDIDRLLTSPIYLLKREAIKLYFRYKKLSLRSSVVNPPAKMLII